MSNLLQIVNVKRINGGVVTCKIRFDKIRYVGLGG